MGYMNPEHKKDLGFWGNLLFRSMLSVGRWVRAGRVQLGP